MGLILKVVQSANRFMRTLLHSGIFLLDSERAAALLYGKRVLQYFQQLANIAFGWSMTRWKYQTKYHFFTEILYTLELEEKDDIPSLNPMSMSTQMEEDFVGRVASASRIVHSRTLHRRTIEAYCVQLRMHW